jgi:hypothetical protein
MKTKSVAFLFLVGSALILFAGCDLDNSRTKPPSEDSEIIIVGSGQTRYFSLDPFAEVADDSGIHSPKWDIAFKPGRIIETNSGATAKALESGGQGGVWHTEKIDIAETALGDRVTEGYFASWNTDDLKYVAGRTGASQQTVNVMNHVAWSSGDGASRETTFTGAQYNSGEAKAFITATPGKMPPDFSPTNRVYIIKHGNGNGYCRIQISGYSSADTIDTYTLNYLKL